MTRPSLRALLPVLAWWTLGACRDEVAPSSPARQQRSAPQARAEPRGAPAASPPAIALEALPTRFPAAERVVAIGDVHGDLQATRAALRLAGAIDEHDQWRGGPLVVVQTGDQLDRGDDEPEILALFARLREQAAAAGGAFHVLNGNHEYMNVLGDLRYVTPEGMVDFAGAASAAAAGPSVSLPAGQRERLAAFAPGGPMARQLASRNTIVVVGDSVFVHGGVRPEVAPDIEAINERARRWLAGIDPHPAPIVRTLMDPRGPVWMRAYSEPEPSSEACAELAKTLRILGVSRMVVGHTVQPQGINAACDGKVWRIDVGLAAHYGGPTQVLEITETGARVLEP